VSLLVGDAGGVWLALSCHQTYARSANQQRTSRRWKTWRYYLNAFLSSSAIPQALECNDTLVNTIICFAPSWDHSFASVTDTTITLHCPLYDKSHQPSAAYVFRVLQLNLPLESCHLLHFAMSRMYNTLPCTEYVVLWALYRKAWVIEDDVNVCHADSQAE